MSRSENCVVRSSRKHCNPNKNDFKSAVGGVCEVGALNKVLFVEQGETNHCRLATKEEDLHTTLALGSDGRSIK